LGFVCTIQISSLSENYILDAFLLREKIGRAKKLFENNEILKIFHGGENDLKWLKTDFNINVMNLYDTNRAEMVISEN
jgi:ribonuclease D